MGGFSLSCFEGLEDVIVEVRCRSAAVCALLCPGHAALSARPFFHLLFPCASLVPLCEPVARTAWATRRGWEAGCDVPLLPWHTQTTVASCLTLQRIKVTYIVLLSYI